MTLFREVDTFANDVVATVFNADNPTFIIHLDPVANSHRIGATDTFQTEVTLYLTIKQLAIVCANGVPTACILNYKTLQLSIINFSIVN